MNLDSFHRGWLVGSFSPALFQRSDVEIGIKQFKAGETEKKHRHLLSDEYTIVISGSIIMNDQLLVSGDIFELKSGVWSTFECVSDAVTVCIRTSSNTTDKQEWIE